MTIVADPVSAPDLLAIVFVTFGIDPAKELYNGNQLVPAAN